MALVLEACDMNRMCRTCLTTQIEVTEINTEIQNMLFDSTGLKIDNRSTLPNKICMVCKQTIHKSYQFRQQCWRSEAILRSVFTSNDDGDPLKDQVDNTLICHSPTGYIKQELKNHYNDGIQCETYQISTEILECPTEKKEILYISDLLDNQCEIMSTRSTNEDTLESVEHNIPMTNQDIKMVELKNLGDKRVTANKYKCDVCKQIFCTSTELKKHYNMLHNFSESIECMICHKVFKVKKELDLHKCRNIKKENRCETCGKIFNRTTNLRRHKLIHRIVQESINCPICDAKFSSKKHYMIHKKSAHRIRRVLDKQICNICGKAVTNVKKHTKRIHTTERPFQCNVCDKAFTFNSELDSHIKQVHEKQKKYSVLCSICGKICDCFSDLKVHMLSHTDEQAFNCALCNRKYKYLSGLRAHVLKHTEHQRFRCNFCFKNCATSQSFKCHLRLHTGERPYACKLCDKAYTKSSALDAHMKFHG